MVKTVLDSCFLIGRTFEAISAFAFGLHCNQRLCARSYQQVKPRNDAWSIVAQGTIDSWSFETHCRLFAPRNFVCDRRRREHQEPETIPRLTCEAC